jgi:hypothetical protein
MSEDVVTNGGFTTKEMLVRMDGKLDVLAANQQHTDIELAMLKERVRQVEDREKADGRDSEAWRAEVRAELVSAKNESALLGRKLAYATGTVGALVFIANFLVPWILTKV